MTTDTGSVLFHNQDLTWASSLAQVELATTGFTSSIYLSFSLEMRKVVMVADQEREFLEPDSFVEVMEELLRSSAIEMVVDIEEEGRGLSLIDMTDKEERKEGPQQEPQVGVNRKETRGWRERIQSQVRQKKITDRQVQQDQSAQYHVEIIE